MSKPPIVDVNNCPTVIVDDVVTVQRLHGITHVVFAETRPCADPRDNGERVRDVNLRLAIPTERVAAICAAIMGGADIPAIDESKATVETWGHA